MNTNNIKSFAKQARLILMEGVKQRLLYWGFDANGDSNENVEVTTGGYIFRGQVFNDDSVPPKWQKLKTKLTNKQAVQDTIEEAAYTWFNRLMAINILEKRGYIQPTLTYVAELKTPQIVQNAKRGQHQLKQQKYIDLLQQYLVDDQEEQALGLLLTRLCNNNILLHDVFGRIDDYTEILLPNNLLQRNGIIDLLNSDVITDTEYKEVELIGWLYQFYISDKKDEVFKGFKANKKARPEDIPAATQIFTPKWIVKYMVENTVGKIYLDFDKTSSLKTEMKYLVEGQEQDTFIARNGAIPSLINHLEELTLIDPASGSGHILVTGFELLFKMYREQGYTAKNAAISILQNNLFGLDIDDRAMQLARFAVLLKAAEFYPEVLNASDSNPLLLPNIYSFPETHHFHLDEIQSFLIPKGATYVAELKEALILLNEGKNIGAALKLELSLEAHAFITNQYKNWNTQAQSGTLDILQQDLWNNLKPFLAVLLVMTKKYSAVVANPPYMGQSNMNAELKNYINENYPLSKSDMFAIFIEAMIEMVITGSRMGCITMESWMFLSSYEKLRNNLIDKYSIVSLAHFGWHILGIAFGTASLILEKSKSIKIGEYSYLTIDDLDRELNIPINFPKQDNGRYANIPQTNFEKIPGSPIAYWVSEKTIKTFQSNLLIDFAKPKAGLQTGNNSLFVRFWHEINLNSFSLSNSKTKDKWFPYCKGGGNNKWYGLNSFVVDWEENGLRIHKYNNIPLTHNGAPVRAKQYYFQEGLSYSLINSTGNFCTRYIEGGFIFDNGGPMIFSDEINVQILAGILNSKISTYYLKTLNPTLNYQVGDLSRIPIPSFDNSKNIELNKMITSSTNISKKDWNSKETSWDFEQSPLLNQGASLKTAYQEWHETITQDFFQLHENEEELNRIFIDIYGLQEELTPDVALKDITILQEELDRSALEQLEPVFRVKGTNAVTLPIKKEEVISQFLSYSIGVFMGRYRLDKLGLHIAHPNPTEEELAPYEVSLQGTSLSVDIDEDGIIPLMGSECAFPDDALVRIKNIIHDLWGETTLTENLNFVNECLGTDLDKWLTEKFYGYHTSMYKKKPIYWLFCSNPKKPQASAFKVLTYMHRMDKYTVSKIQRNYLHPHQEWIKHEIEKAVANESNLSKNELKRLDKLRAWELECRDYNEVLKTLALNEIVFDLDDGVSVNYEKFEEAVAKI